MDLSGLSCVFALLERRFERHRSFLRIAGLSAFFITAAGFSMEEPLLWLCGLATITAVAMTVAGIQCLQMQSQWNRGEMEPLLLSRVSPAELVDGYLAHNLRNTLPWLGAVGLAALGARLQGVQSLQAPVLELIGSLLLLVTCSSLFVVAYRLACQVGSQQNQRRITRECALPAVVLGLSCLADGGNHAPESFLLASAGAALGIVAARWWTIASLTGERPSTSGLDSMFPLLLAVPFAVMAFSSTTRHETAAGLVLGGVVVAGCLGLRACLCALRGRMCPQELCLAGAPSATLLGWLLASLEGHAAAPALLLVALSLCAPLWGALAGVYLSEVKSWSRLWRAAGLGWATLAVTWLITVSLTMWALAPQTIL